MWRNTYRQRVSSLPGSNVSAQDMFDDYADWCEEHDKAVYFHRLKALGGGVFQIFRGIQSWNTGVLSSIEQPYLGGGKVTTADVDNLLNLIEHTSDCRLLAPGGLPTIEREHIFPDDLARFYALCGGAVIYESSAYCANI